LFFRHYILYNRNYLYINKHLKKFLVYSIMEKINLLDLNNDVLNIIGDYVKKDNTDRITTDYNRREDKKRKK
jgi:hypothetical protein